MHVCPKYAYLYAHKHWKPYELNVDYKTKKWEVKISYMEDKGPKRGFSLRGWNEHLPKNLRLQLSPKSLGQSLINIATTNTTIFNTTNSAVIHELLLYLSMTSKYRNCSKPWGFMHWMDHFIASFLIHGAFSFNIHRTQSSHGRQYQAKPMKSSHN